MTKSCRRRSSRRWRWRCGTKQEEGTRALCGGQGVASRAERFGKRADNKGAIRGEKRRSRRRTPRSRSSWRRYGTIRKTESSFSRRNA
jgi:hypothetical protein